jgi:hypothetical protein
VQIAVEHGTPKDAQSAVDIRNTLTDDPLGREPRDGPSRIRDLTTWLLYP